VGISMKNHAMARIRKQLDAQRRKGTGELVVAGGDLNLNRCLQPLRTPEQWRCSVREGHRAFLDSGYRDAVRTLNRGGRTGVTGVERRIDFIYAKAKVTSSWFDRCYQAFFAESNPCRPSQKVFARNAKFLKCQARSLNVGRPGASCPANLFRRYYSDHPIQLATLH